MLVGFHHVCTKLSNFSLNYLASYKNATTIIFRPTFLFCTGKNVTIPHIHRRYATISSTKISTPVAAVPDSEKVSAKRTVSMNTLCGDLVNKAPSFLQPYLKLMRLDKPTGVLLLLWPSYWSIALAADPGHWPSFFHLAIFAVGAVAMRGAGCTVNDMWDKEFDQKVKRTMNRPLSSGAVSMPDALAFSMFQATLGIFVLSQLNWYSILLGYGVIFPIILYPLAKRFTYWPQMVLGVTFNWGALIGWASIHASCYWPVVLPLYIAAISWTLVYDTIYAHQDKVHDAAVGIKSTALRFGNKTKTWLSLFSASMIGNLLLVGAACQQTLPYYGAVGLVGLHLCKQLWTLDINNSEDCMRKFQSNNTIGLILFTGIVGGTLLKTGTII